MTIKLGSLARWKMFPLDALNLPGRDGGERRIRLNINAESEIALYRVFRALDDQQLVAVLAPGFHTVEFMAAGTVSLIAAKQDGAQVWYQTADDEPTYVEVVDPVIFTRIANRRHRNPELEEMMYRMQLNVERRLAAQAEELEQALSRRRAEEEHGRPAEKIVTNAPGSAAAAGGEEVRAPEPVAPESGEAPGGAGGGGQPGGGADPAQPAGA